MGKRCPTLGGSVLLSVWEAIWILATRREIGSRCMNVSSGRLLFGTVVQAPSSINSAINITEFNFDMYINLWCHVPNIRSRVLTRNWFLNTEV